MSQKAKQDTVPEAIREYVALWISNAGPVITDSLEQSIAENTKNLSNPKIDDYDQSVRNWLLQREIVDGEETYALSEPLKTFLKGNLREKNIEQYKGHLLTIAMVLTIHELISHNDYDDFYELINSQAFASSTRSSRANSTDDELTNDAVSTPSKSLLQQSYVEDAREAGALAGMASLAARLIVSAALLAASFGIELLITIADAVVVRLIAGDSRRTVLSGRLISKQSVLRSPTNNKIKVLQGEPHARTSYFLTSHGLSAGSHE